MAFLYGLLTGLCAAVGLMALARLRQRAAALPGPEPIALPASEAPPVPGGPAAPAELLRLAAEHGQCAELRARELSAESARSRAAWDEVRRLRDELVRQAGELRDSQERTQAQVRATLRARDVAREAEETRDGLQRDNRELEGAFRAARAACDELTRELSEARAELARRAAGPDVVLEPAPPSANGRAGRAAARASIPVDIPGQRSLWE